MEDFSSSEAKKNTEFILDIPTAASSKVYIDVAYSFKDNAVEDSEWRKEKPRMSLS